MNILGNMTETHFLL